MGILYELSLDSRELDILEECINYMRENKSELTRAETIEMESILEEIERLRGMFYYNEPSSGGDDE